MNYTDLIGSVGVGMLLLAYLLQLKGRILADGWVYLGLNTLGAALACLASVLLLYWPFVVLEGCWTLVSLWGLFGYYQKRKAAVKL